LYELPPVISCGHSDVLQVNEQPAAKLINEIEIRNKKDGSG